MKKTFIALIFLMCGYSAFIQADGWDTGNTVNTATTAALAESTAAIDTRIAAAHDDSTDLPTQMGTKTFTVITAADYVTSGNFQEQWDFPAIPDTSVTDADSVTATPGFTITNTSPTKEWMYFKDTAGTASNKVLKVYTTKYMSGAWSTNDSLKIWCKGDTTKTTNVDSLRIRILALNENSDTTVVLTLSPAYTTSWTLAGAKPTVALTNKYQKYAMELTVCLNYGHTVTISRPYFKK